MNASLYYNYWAKDIRDIYVFNLRTGMDEVEAFSNLFAKFVEFAETDSEGHLFWLVLADTQWKYGRLDPFVKEKAIEIIETGIDDIYWQSVSPENLDIRQKNINEIYIKLKTTNPEPVKLSKFNPYICPWKDGDVFAYHLTSEQSKQYGLFNKYILFRKIKNTSYGMVDQIPMITIFNWYGDFPPNNATMVEKTRVIPLFSICRIKHYSKVITNRRKEKIPKEKITYIGNVQSTIYPLTKVVDGEIEIQSLAWSDFEQYFFMLFEHFLKCGYTFQLSEHKILREDKEW